jgi:hypothetical protein
MILIDMEDETHSEFNNFAGSYYSGYLVLQESLPPLIKIYLEFLCYIK